LTETEREYDAKDPAQFREFDDALFAALAAAREYYRGNTFTPNHPRLWLLISEHGDADQDQVRLRILRPPSQPVMVRIRLIDKDGGETSFDVTAFDLLRKGRP
jgi:hypothetical protein